MKNALLLTSSNLASNPRCLKEVQLLYKMDLSITVVAFDLHNWTNEKEIEINRQYPKICFHYLEATKKKFFSWFISSVIEIAGRSLFYIFSSNIYIAALASGKRSWLLLQWSKMYIEKTDIIIAHNPSAFYPAYRLAKKMNSKFAIDVEDFHPGEGTNINQQRSVSVLMKKLLPAAAYVSFASPLIKKYTIDLLMFEDKKKFIEVNNVFSFKEFINPASVVKTGKLKLVWFSQFIDYGRGLEIILPQLDLFYDDLELTLIGSIRPGFFSNEIQNRKYINCLQSLSQKNLNEQLCNYDIGLAIEEASIDVNRNICLTNKLWSYFQSGLFILASDTDAQKKFIEEHYAHGILTSLKSEDLVKKLNILKADKILIRQKAEERFNLAKLYNWETESQILRNKWNDILITE